MEDFYEKTGGVTILVVKHEGMTHSMVNGSGKYNVQRDYFPKWQKLLPWMKVGKFYAIICTVKQTSRGSKASLNPMGIALEIDNLEDAKALSFEHRAQVEGGVWNPQEAYLELQRDWIAYQKKVLSEIGD